MDHVLQFFQQVDNLVWGAPLLVLLVGTGIYLTFAWVCFRYATFQKLFA